MHRDYYRLERMSTLDFVREKQSWEEPKSGLIFSEYFNSKSWEMVVFYNLFCVQCSFLKYFHSIFKARVLSVRFRASSRVGVLKSGSESMACSLSGARAGGESCQKFLTVCQTMGKLMGRDMVPSCD